jgi:signal recognition particle receptor subunit beta
MVLFNYSTKELTAKLVYYGPGLCGKTTNLQFIYDNLPQDISKGKMLSLATKTDRTLFFDFLPLDLGTIRGMKTRVQLYTVPGQVFYNSTRKMVLKGADGVVFVADSQAKMMDANIESFANLEENLTEQGLKLEQIPLVLQFNKRDLPGLASIEDLNTALNRYNAPFYEAIAINGIGVHDTLRAGTKLVLNSLTHKYRLDKEKGAAPAEPAERPGSRPTSAPASRPTAAPAARAAAPTASIPVAVAAEDDADAGVLEVVEQEEDAVLELVEEPPAPDPGATMRLSAASGPVKPSTRPALVPDDSMDELEVIPLQGSDPVPAPARPAAPAMTAAAPRKPEAPAAPEPAPSWLDSGRDDFPALERSQQAVAPAGGVAPIVLRVKPGESPSLSLPLRIETGGRTLEYTLNIQLQLRTGR